MSKEKTKSNGKTFTTKPAPTTTTTKTTTKTITHDMIAARAYAIYKSGKGGTAQDHWAQAERELKSGR